MKFTHKDYTVAWICALPLELAATKAILDELHDTLPQSNFDHNTYTFGAVSGHNVVVVCLPDGVYGKVSASTVVSQMLSTFREIRFGLMVGIGGGVPSTGVDIRLGDVVISKPVGRSGGVEQYDYGKTLRDGKFQYRGSLNKPRPILLTALSQMECDRNSRRCQVRDILNAVQTEFENRQKYSRPSDDWLFRATYDHPDDTEDCSTCDQSQLVYRDPRETSMPDLHYGLIASGDQLMKNAKIRDSIGNELNLLCFEMEAAGFMDQLQPLVIRGICDYCDSHKNKKWQRYAAIAAASYAKVFLSGIPTTRIISIDVKLREYYETGNRLRIKRLSGDFLDMEQCYINLSVIEYQHQKKELKSQAEPLASGFSLLDRLKVKADTPEKEVTLPNLFRDRKLPDGKTIQPRRVLIRGRAGVGKTTLCKKIVHDFYHQQMWAALFDRVIWIPLRRLKGVPTLEEFFRRDYFPSQAKRDDLVLNLWKTVFDDGHKRTLWLLDGLDEISGDRDFGSDLTESFNSLLNQDSVVITSRPYALHIPGLSPFDLELETVGFHSSQVRTYLGRTIKDPVVTNQIQSFIRSHWLIQGLVRIPIQLDALCYSWNEYNSLADALPHTMTEIYRAIELKLWRKDILNLEKRNNTGRLSGNVVQNLRTRVQIQYLVETEMELLECLAFTGLYSDIIELHQAHRDWLYEQPQFCEMSDDVLDRLSFLRTSDTPSQANSYHFIHLTFQEYFAAQYFVRCFISDSSKPLLCLKRDRSRGKYIMKISPETFLQEAKYSYRYNVFWRFVTGLLYSIDEVRVCSFFKDIEGEPRDLLGPAHQRLLMHCFSEIPTPSASEPAGYVNDYLRLLREKMELGCIRWSDYEYRHLEKMQLCSEIEFPENVLCKLLGWGFLQRRSSYKRKILAALARRWHLSLDLMSIVTDYMDDSDSDVRWASINALRTKSPWPPKTLEAVIRRLGDENLYVRDRAVQALLLQSRWLPETLEALMCRLKQDNLYVIEGAIKALSTQSPWPLETFRAVMRQLDHDNENIRQAAFNSLHTQSPWPQETFKAVLCQLENDNENVRYEAIQALATQSSWTLDTLKAVTCHIENDTEDIRRLAIYSLRTQSSWPPETLQAVMCQLEDGVQNVKEAAIYALGVQSRWVPETLMAVARLLETNNWIVQRAAVDALRTQSLWPMETLKAVVCLLEHDKEDVRWAAIQALGTQTLWPLEIFKEVMFRLGHDKEDVRWAAIQALGTQTLWPLEISKAVMFRLEHDKEDVRWAAIQALGEQSSWLPETYKAVMCQIEDASPVVRRVAITALANRLPWPPETFRAVMYGLQDNDEDVRWVAIQALSTQHPWSLETFKAVTCTLQDDDDNVRYAATEALATQSAWPAETLKAVMDQLENADKDLRRGAIHAIASQRPWPLETLNAVTYRLQDVNKEVKRAAIKALGTQSNWPLETFKAVMCQLEDANQDVRRAATKALGKQTPWPSEILKGVLCQLKNEDSGVVSRLEAFLWRNDDFFSPLFSLDANAASALCKIWAQKSIHETFVCYVYDGSVYFETSAGQSSFPLSKENAQLLKHILWVTTLQSPILRLVYASRTSFSHLRS